MYLALNLFKLGVWLVCCELNKGAQLRGKSKAKIHEADTIQAGVFSSNTCKGIVSASIPWF